MKKIIYLLLLFYIVVAVLSIVFFRGTGDPGDSIYHFLFAKYAPQHPELFFDQWAKPVFVLFACPFAQFGFSGIKVFNAIVTFVTLFLTYKTAEALKVRNAVCVVVLMIFAPLYYILTFSGLTEPLFALFVSGGIYLAVKKKFAASCFVISLLPFVRSEGLIFIGLFCFFLLVKRQWKSIPLLLAGTVLFSFAGDFIHHDFLWVFTKIPYAKLSSPYGSGTPFHYVVQMLYVVGIPIYFLFWVGFVSILVKSIREKVFADEQMLIVLGFLCFFLAHSLFWYFGIFNSMGLKRVLICVMPIISIIALQGYNFLTEDVFQRSKVLRVTIQGILLAYIVVFPFTHNPAAINWKRDMMISKDQQLAKGAAGFVEQKIHPGSVILCAHPYLCMVLNIDCFDQNKRLGFSRKEINGMKKGDFLIWENWFSVVESKVRKEDLDKNPDLLSAYNVKANDDGHEILYSVYEK